MRGERLSHKEQLGRRGAGSAAVEGFDGSDKP